MATSLILADEKKNLFRILAYKKAAEIISTSNEEFYELWREKKLAGISGIGKGITALLDQLFSSGHAKDLEEQIEKYPPEVYTLQNIRGIGPKTALAIAKILTNTNKNEYTNTRRQEDMDKSIRRNPYPEGTQIRRNPSDEKVIIDKVIQLCKEHKIASLPGFGEKSEQDILNAVLKFKEGNKKDKRINLADALPLAEKFIEYMKLCKDVEKIEVLGSLRRRMETVGDIDLAATSNNPAMVIKHFVAYKYAGGKIQEGDNKASFEMPSGLHVDLRVINPNQWGSMLAHFTGSKEHNVALREFALKKGMSISEYGIKGNRGNKGLKTFKTEEEFYKFLGLQYIPPELRENRGEIEESLRQAQGKLPGLPTLVDLSDIKGDLHMHTNFDVSTSHDLGASTPEEMVEKAIRLGYKYSAFSEHNPSMSKNSKTQKTEILKKKQEMVNRLNQRYQRDLYIFNSLEVDILPNGSLAIEEEHTKYLDFVIASIHSSFEQDKDKQTARILKALNFPKVKIFGHPTGRLVDKRESISFDREKIFEMCASKKIAVEISASPFRNDLNWKEILKLKEFDISYIINTDSHDMRDMDLMKFGVWNARKGWLTAKNVVNTWNLTDIKKFMLV